MNKITIPSHYNYIEVYLTFDCQLNCHYCINKTYGKVAHYKSLSVADWIRGLSRLDTNDIPLTFGGGEPTIHKDFYKIVNGIDKPMDLLSNGQFDKYEFMANISAKKFKRNAPYASIRFSYHSGITPLFPLLRKARAMNKRGYEIGIWAVLYPNCINDVVYARQIAEQDFGLDFRFKDFLGVYNGKLYGNYKYPEAVDGVRKNCECRPSEMLISPNGNLYKCHYDLYNNVNSYGNILDKNVKVPDDYGKCDNFGLCSYCDIKNKFDRWQVKGHCSVSIK